MKKTISLLLVLLCVLGLLLTGCRSAGPAVSDQSTTPADNGDSTQPEGNADADTIISIPGAEGKPLQLDQAGKLRIPYTGAADSVRYITDPSQLPDYPELAAYDEAYFQEHALLLVTRTVNSGSAEVTIGSVVIENGVAVVYLEQEAPEGAGTADMATWLLWAETEKGLEYDWSLENAAEGNQNELY